jgi:acyl transferase domain-containing protein
LLLSARAPASLTRMAARLADRLERDPGLPLSDVAFTLALGRRAFEHRCAVVARDAAEAARQLKGAAPGPLAGVAGRERRELVFLFPGQGAQHVGMGRQLYRQEPVFRAAFDRCADVALARIGSDLREVLFAAGDEDEAAAGLLRDTRLAQPALFSVSYALAALLGSWGLRPDLMIGHSVGEFVAACLASVMSVEDAVCLVAERGRLMQSMPRGGMLSVRAAADQIAAKLGPALSIAAVNSPKLCVVAGPDEAVDALASQLEAQGVAASRLHTSHAFHSSMMDPAIGPFEQCVRRVRLSAPRVPIVSTVTGRLLTDAEAVDPSYWARHLRATVRFADAVAEAWKEPSRLLVDVGPRGTNAQLARQTASDLTAQVVVPVLDGKTGAGEWSSLLRAAGQLFCHGLSVDLEALFRGEGRRRLPLPAYSFERTRHFVEPGMPLWEGSAPRAVAPGPVASEPQAVVTGPAALVQRQLQIIARQVELLTRGADRSGQRQE